MHVFGSHPSWVCGLKQYWRTLQVRQEPSHPSWVCGLKLSWTCENHLGCRSHPSWVCGLKLKTMNKEEIKVLSHPSWVCGLKLYVQGCYWCHQRSHPSWVCGLKHLFDEVLAQYCVTPFVGVWIETLGVCKERNLQRSHPSWVCGLKPDFRKRIENITCHTLRGCVDWNKSNGYSFANFKVTPFVGVWIETLILQVLISPLQSHPSWVCGLKPLRIRLRWRNSPSHPSWVCGLKHNHRICLKNQEPVTPFVGVWIETFENQNELQEQKVTPFVGVWIETFCRHRWLAWVESHPSWVCGLKLLDSLWQYGSNTSHPSWVCGLKHSVTIKRPKSSISHTLRGCVDWNIPIKFNVTISQVTPFVGVWIETQTRIKRK